MVRFDYFDYFYPIFLVMKTVLSKPTKAEQKFARETMNELEKISSKKKSAYHIYISFQFKEKKESLEVPNYVVRCLKYLLSNMVLGNAVQIASVNTELSTQEAADMLGVSRPHVVKLLEQNKIPFKKVGTHRRIDLKDLQAYERKQKFRRQRNLSLLAEQAQDLKLGYEV